MTPDLAAQLDEQVDLTALLEGRYNHEHQRGLQLELRAMKAERAVRALQAENIDLRARITDLEAKENDDAGDDEPDAESREHDHGGGE